MTKKIFAIAAFLFLPIFAARAETSRITVELDGEAVVVWADESVAPEIMDWLKSGEFKTASRDEITKKIVDRYGGAARAEVFFDVKAEKLTGARKSIVPLREAVLSGAIPPIEGLAPDDVPIILGIFGFSVLGAREFSMMSEVGIAQKLVESNNRLLVFNGTGPFDEIAIYSGEKEETSR
jgi:hypothetical protein